MYEIIFILSFYFIGAIPTGYLIGKMQGIDIRTKGSGNIGATNVLRVLGVKWGILVLIIDVTKAYLGLLLLIPLYFNLTTISINPDLVKVIGAIITISGNILNPFFKFKGGKGVAASVGVLLYIAPKILGIAFLVFLIVVILTKYVSLGSLSGALTSLILVFIIDYNIYKAIFIVILVIFIFVKHKSNIRRLIKGEENKLSFSKKKK